MTLYFWIQVVKNDSAESVQFESKCTRDHCICLACIANESKFSASKARARKSWRKWSKVPRLALPKEKKSPEPFFITDFSLNSGAKGCFFSLKDMIVKGCFRIVLSSSRFSWAFYGVAMLESPFSHPLSVCIHFETQNHITLWQDRHDSTRICCVFLYLNSHFQW